MHNSEGLRFPEGFLWGAATSAFQVEGDVRNSDWWRWEQTHQPVTHRSGRAIDQYHRFPEDFDILKELGHNTHRLGLEWSKIEPRPGEFDPKEITHYKEVLKALRERDIKVMLTLHHFSNPGWLADMGGWENPNSATRFENFVKRVVPELGEGVDLWITINEPSVYSTLAYLTANFPPQRKNPFAALKVYWNMARAHQKAYQAIHAENPQAAAGMAKCNHLL